MGKPQGDKAATMAVILDECRASWEGPQGERRADAVQKLLARVLPEYAAALGIAEDAVLEAIEKSRDYTAVNYYQEANFPKLADVELFDTVAAFRAAFPSGRYVCPACGAHSTLPSACDAGTPRENGEPCDWKAYGFFRTMGKGLRIVVRDQFLDHPAVHEIFMPVERAA